MSEQLSENFYREEFACKCGCGFDTVDAALLELLQEIRDHFGRKVTITSGCRCPDYNDLIGGSEKSQHLLGRAADIVVENIRPADVQEMCEVWEVPGLGKYSDFTHVDTRTGGARW